MIHHQADDLDWTIMLPLQTGGAAGFKLDLLTWNFGIAASPGVELNNGAPLGAGASANGVHNTDLSSFNVGL